VSSKEQEVEGFSIPAQLELLRGYACKQGMKAVQEFVDVESASTSGRTGFGQMLAFLKKNRSKCQTILVEKTDRLYRNVPDYATVDELGVTIHFVKDGTILSPDSKSSEQFIHGIKVLMARNYSQNLGEETLKGMLQKAKSGLYPSNAPAGYRNAEGSDGRRIIVPDRDAPTITRLFEEFATGRYSLKTLAATARVEGWTVGGRRLHRSTLHLILRKRIYTGDLQVPTPPRVTDDEQVSVYVSPHDCITGSAVGQGAPRTPQQVARFEGKSGLVVFSDSNAFRRVRIVHAAIGMPNAEAVISAVANPAIDLSRTVVLQGPPPVLETCEGGDVEVPRYRPTSVVLQVNSPCRGMVLLADTWFPGWTAYVDGKPTQIYRAYNMIRGVVVQRGEHEVILLYRQPTSSLVC
jgi:DNA invertase Pin-like site-specific DNA recombinase